MPQKRGYLFDVVLRAGRFSLPTIAVFALGLLLSGRLGPVAGQISIEPPGTTSAPRRTTAARSREPAKVVWRAGGAASEPQPVTLDAPVRRTFGPRSAEVTWPRVAQQPDDVGERSVDPPSSGREVIPFSGFEDESGGEIEIDGRNGRVSIIVRDAPLNQVLAMLARNLRLNIVASSEINSNVTITLEDVELKDALNSILSIAGYTWVRHRGIIHVTSAASVSSLPPETQGRETRVFQLHYALAVDIEPIVRGLLSPVGKVFFTSSSPADNRKTQETIVVEDLPPYLDRVAAVLAQADIAPRQVLIEAHVLEVELKDDNRHGVNLNFLSDISDSSIQLELRGMANPTAPQAFFATLQGGELATLVELIKNTTDSKTLASPRVLVINGQQARIQVGEQLGFRVTTTTETSTLETVNFLNVGVVLNVTPRISPNGEVLMHVKPEVSSGEVNQNTGLPEEETTEVETSILLQNGQGVVIGGLIQERAIDNQGKLPWLGDLKLIGRLFQHRNLSKSRSEIIIALVPRIVPFDPHYQMRSRSEFMRSQTPILGYELHRLPRVGEDQLPDAITNPRRIFRLPPVVVEEGPVYEEVYSTVDQPYYPPVIIEEEVEELREPIPVPQPER